MPAPEKIKNIKSELNSLEVPELVDICLKLARLKTENKEMLHYLIYEATDDLQYAELIKSDLDDIFQNLNDNSYFCAKNLRRALRLIAKYRRFTRSAQGEAELLIHFAKQFLQFADLNTRYQPLHLLLHRAYTKARKLLRDLHEDLQYDYERQLDELKEEISRSMKHWNQRNLPL